MFWKIYNPNFIADYFYSREYKEVSMIIQKREIVINKEK